MEGLSIWKMHLPERRGNENESKDHFLGGTITDYCTNFNNESFGRSANYEVFDGAGRKTVSGIRSSMKVAIINIAVP